MFKLTKENLVFVDEGHKGKASKDSRKWTGVKNKIAKTRNWIFAIL